MSGPIARYAQWLHTRWPAGRVEKLPDVGPDGLTNVEGVRMSGDLAGVPLLKFALDSGVRAIRALARDLPPGRDRAATLDLLIVGAGVSGLAAAAEARTLGLSFEVLEAAEPLATVRDFPLGKPIFTYPRAMIPAGALQVGAPTRETLLEELRAQVEALAPPIRQGRAERIERRNGLLSVRIEGGGAIAARRVLVAIGRSGDYRRLGVPGEALEKVHHRLHDPADHRGRDALVVGGGDSALEAAAALAGAGARVTLVHRGADFPRARPENVARAEALRAAGRLALHTRTRVRAIAPAEVVLEQEESSGARAFSIPNSIVFTQIGREAPLGFLRRSGIRIAGERPAAAMAGLAALLVALALLYDWKSAGFLDAALWSRAQWPADMPAHLAGLGAWWAARVADRATWLGTLAVSMQGRSFYYTFAYTLVVGFFGLRRVQRRDTPYVRRQTLVLFLVQALPLFVLPELVLPWLGYHGAFDRGAGRALGDALFERTIPVADYAARHWPAWGHPRAYWRAYGLILAWPLDVYDVFTAHPMPAWLAIGFVQTFVLLPLAVARWGKGVYCGWICSCGALAETAGDALRIRMPHGPRWNRLNMLGQGVLAFAFVLLALRIVAWCVPSPALAAAFDFWLEGRDPRLGLVNPFAYKWLVDVLLGGVLGVGLYLQWSGRTWCRFACPLAALMHVYARFSRFAIVPEKRKCISCNVCTSVCHQGIDVMAFANKGLPMQDPQCVRCSACVHDCPTGVLAFGQVDRGGQLIRLDSLVASPVRRREAANEASPAAGGSR